MAIVEKIEQDQLLLYEILRNPVLAGEFIYNYDIREGIDQEFEFTSYQREMLSDFSTHQSYCTARATGKCLHKDSMILDPSNGEYHTVKYWYDTGELSSILSIDSNWKQNVDKPIIEPNGIKDCIKISTTKGFETTVTFEHPMLTNRGFIKASELKIGDYIASVKYIHTFGSDILAYDEVLALAHFIAEGTYHNGSITTTDEEVVQDIYRIASYFDCTIRQEKITYHLVGGLGHGKNSKIPGIKNTYLDFLGKIGIRNKHAINKYIPQNIFRLNKEQLSLFLNRLFSDDGWCIIGKSNYEVGYATASERLAKDLQHLLLRFGIVSTLSYKNNKGAGAWTLSIKGDGVISFYDQIGFCIKRKQEKLFDLVTKSKSFFNQADIIPIPSYKEYSIIRADETYSRKLSYYPTREKAKRIINKDEEFSKFEDADIFWVKIKNIEIVKDQETYAVEVLENHTLLADNLWSHNTVSMVSIIIWLVVFNVFPKDAILFATPSKVHLQPVWDGLTRSFRSNSFLKQFISPAAGINSSNNTMKFLNFTMLDCRIAGQTGTGANFAGAHVPIIFCEEAGYFPWAAFQEMQPCLNTFTPGYREVVAGVPTGIRENSTLYFADQVNSAYSHHRVSAFDNPRLTKEDHDHAEEQYGGKDNPDYVHYHLGEHGLPVFALFDRGMMAIEQYPVYKLVINGQQAGENLNEYLNKLSIFSGIPEKKAKVVIGVDLGYTEPTAIVIMYTDQYGRLRFHGRIQLEKVSYTLQERIIDFLDTKFDPVIIGMDKGSAGISTYQHLVSDKEYYSKNYEKRLMPVDFSGAVTLGVDADGEEVKSKTKPFSVSVLQDYTNNHKIIYSSTDLEMITELERMTYTKNVNGDIAYRTLTIKGGKKGEDHFTSALLCATLSYYLTTDFMAYRPERKVLAKPRWM